KGSEVTEPTELEKFLQLNPLEKFDLEAINSVDAQVLVGEARENKRVLREVLRTAEALLPRVRAETEDPILVSAILRSKTLDWYRRSSSDPGWTDTMPLRWGGIFYESRVPGGRLSRKLSTRLSNLISQCVEASGTVAFLRAGVTGLFRGSAMMALDSRFHPGMEPVAIRVVSPKNQDDAATYDLVHGGTRAVRESGAPDEATTESTPASPWERSDMTKKEWLALFKSLEKRKE